MDELWDIGRLSEYLGIKRSTLYTMIERKEIPHYRIGKLARFRPAEIDEWLMKKRCQAETLARTRKARRMFRSLHGEAKTIVQEAIDEVKLQGYTSFGESDRIKGLGKEE
ncbi:MAG TPA: helix-turn-helix domain-containing protein [Syntrophorhabdales bacterium]|nr:helix-turn-helix domain-containing protein [Syntrophorhabdales bacterium]